MNDPYKLQRFVDAQSPIFDRVRSELTNGEKRSHWMWFIFPQIQGLGYSMTSRKFAISSLDEAKAYLAHPILGPRLIECAQLVNGVKDRSIGRILGSPDDMKFHSSMTLFSIAAPENPVFPEALQKYFEGRKDPATIQKLELKG